MGSAVDISQHEAATLNNAYATNGCSDIKYQKVSSRLKTTKKKA
jgi:hypothetical protein